MRLLLISNSTMAGQPYLEYPKFQIKNFLGNKPLKIIFIPYAAVTFSYDAYEEKVNNRLNEIGQQVASIHRFANPREAVENAEVIMVGGGNTWNLLHWVHKNKLLDPIRKKVLGGAPYVGWSAGANLACPTIKTTNDMPIIDPEGMDALNLVPFQINPHYLDANPEGHGGETREERILEFLAVNQKTTVVGLREGCMFLINNKKVNFIGERNLCVFQHGKSPFELAPQADFDFLLNL
jgi:dipeptidase E